MSDKSGSRDSRMSDVSNKLLRHAVHKNVLEQTVCETTTRYLDAQRRTVSTRMSREEQGLRVHLQKLMDEQKGPDEEDDVLLDGDCGKEENLSDLCRNRLLLSDDCITNPYPISVKPRTSSDTTEQGGDTEADVFGSGLWAGDPEAISSVRRARKPPCRQRFDNQNMLARSRSLKERPSTARAAGTGEGDGFGAGGGAGGGGGGFRGGDSGPSTPRSFSRAGSLKDRPVAGFIHGTIGGGSSGGSGIFREKGVLLRAGSLKDHVQSGGGFRASSVSHGLLATSQTSSRDSVSNDSPNDIATGGSRDFVQAESRMIGSTLEGSSSKSGPRRAASLRYKTVKETT